MNIDDSLSSKKTFCFYEDVVEKAQLIDDRIPNLHGDGFVDRGAVSFIVDGARIIKRASESGAVFLRRRSFCRRKLLPNVRGETGDLQEVDSRVLHNFSCIAA